MPRPVHIIASPFKTGTSSVATALEILGVGNAPMPHQGALLRDVRPAIRRSFQLINKHKSFHEFRAQHGAEICSAFGDLSAAMRGFDIFHDAPVGHSHIHPFVLKMLLPQAQFIWVKRPLGEWLRSVQSWETSHPDTYRNHKKWLTDPDEMVALKIRRRHQAREVFGQARRAFRNDTLILEWDDLGHFEKLATFYGVAAPKEAFPHQNRSMVGS